MKRMLKKIEKKLIGKTENLRGEVSGLRGNVSELRGEVSGLWGDVDKCNLTNEDRKNGIDIKKLIKGDN